jgi:hypothetical protein
MWVTINTKLEFLHQRINIRRSIRFALFRYRAQFYHVAIRVAYKHLHISHCFFSLMDMPISLQSTVLPCGHPGRL